MKFFNTLQKAEFLSRPNRFIVFCRLNGRKVKAFLPNPGRLQELLLPGVHLFLEKCASRYRKTAYTAVAVEGRKGPIVLHTHLTNQVARRLIEEGLVPGLEDAELIRDPDFQRLMTRRSRWRWGFSGVLIVAYLLYGVLGVYLPTAYATPFIGSLPLGMVMGLSIIVLTIALSIWYVGIATRLEAEETLEQGRHR